MKEKNFKNWHSDDVENVFKLQEVEKLQHLEDWLTITYELSEMEQKSLQQFQELLKEEAEAWNEEELKFQFIAPLINLVKFKTAYYKPFLERHISAVVEEQVMKGRIDFMLASGKWRPVAPYFCLHEYKKEQGIDNDPRGQLLAEMVAIQALSNNQYPVYGTYVLGRWWFFVVLHEKKYSVSLAYDATKDDLFDIFSILQQLKVIIEDFIEKE